VASTTQPAVTLHFHPDWPHGDGLVIESMARDGVYAPQWVTGVSNGLLDTQRDGHRWRWESRLFDGRYDEEPPEARPVYGSWNRHSDRYGGSPRFGSAYLRLTEDAALRASYCWPDSFTEPDDRGGPEDRARLSALADAGGHSEDPLDDYVEAQVHGGLRLDRDVAAVVLDPCHADGLVRAAADALGVPVEVHGGYRVATADLPEDYRGPAPLALARALGDHLTPDAVAAARRTGAHDPQTVKQVWHLLARFGRAWS